MRPRSFITFVQLLVLFTAGAMTAQAQAPAGARPLPPGGIGEIRGKLADSASGRAVTSGSITVRRDTAFAGGALPKEDGSFRVDGLLPGKYNIRIRALGFGQVVRSNITITADKPVIDLGVIKLNTMAASIAGQDVVAEREETVVQPDRTSYSTKNMTAATGGTAVDVLRNIPQVEVDGNNNVSLRGNGNVVIQINGRATPLKGDQLATFLAQMPANVVKTVEVAANPSAKDDPEGTAGIINIVLNQEAELGLSGGIGAGTASTGQASFYGNVGRQQGKVTWYVAPSIYSDHRIQTGTISRENILVPTPKFVETTLSGTARPLSGGGNARGEYRLTDLNSITLDSYFYGGRFSNSFDNQYIDLDGARDPIGLFNQANQSHSNNMSQDYDVAFRRQGKPTMPQLTVEAEFSNNNSTNDNNLSGVVTQQDPSTPASIQAEHDHTVGKYPYFNSKVDYSHPFDPHTKLELGGKYQDRTTATDFTAAYLNPNTDVFTDSAQRATSYTYREHIGGAYALLSRSFGKFQTQEGMRLEDAQTMFDLPLANLHFDKHYASIYPSGIVTYNFTDLRSARVSYSRRVSRPNPYQLSPIENKIDSRNLFRGNPSLGAEYTDALDFNFQEAHTWGSLQVNPYFRRTNNAVRNIQYIDSTGISVSTFENLAHNSTLGTDMNVNYRHGAFTGAGGGSMSYYQSDASNLVGTFTTANLSTKAFSWNLRANGTWKFTNTMDAQMFTNYRAPTKTEGGSSLAFVNMSFGFRYKIWGDQGSLSVRANDPFNLSKFGYRTANGQIVEFSQRYFGARALYVSISRNFGQALRLKPKSDSDSNLTSAPSP